MSKLKRVRSALVTGATGFIGSALVRRLSSEGLRVFCLVRPASPGVARVRDLPGVELLETGTFDCTALSQKLSGIEADVIFNLASAGVAPEDRDPHQLLTGNLGVVVGLIAAISHWRPRRFIQVGSCSEYGPMPEGHLLTENDLLSPISVYGAAKACAHIYGAALAGLKNIPFNTVRLFGVFGLGEAAYRLVPYTMTCLQRDVPVDLTGGQQIRDFLHVDDVVAALLLSAESDALVPGCSYNICSGKGISIREMAESVAELMNKPKSLLRFGARPYRPDETMWIVGDNKRFTSLTGWVPRVTIQEGIHQMISARRNQ
jgi:nucleoside-diphosphate-sugar epimerase